MTNLKEEQLRVNVKMKVRRIKIFYLHLALYIISTALILYNFYIIEEGPYKDNIISLNLSFSFDLQGLQQLETDKMRN